MKTKTETKQTTEQKPKPRPWGKKEDAFIAAVKKWLSKPHTRAEIEAMSKDFVLLYQTCGYAPKAWAKATDILRDELHKRDVEADRPALSAKEIGQTVAKELAKTRAKEATENRECGCLAVFNDFQKVLCQKKPYDLTDATQARELLRFLCSKKALSKSTAQKKSDILGAMKTSGGTVANDWRPAHVFRGKLAQLYRDAIGRNATKGLYWINP